MINWANIEREHSNFKNRTPTKWAFIEEFLDNDFYEELYNTYQNGMIHGTFKRLKKKC